MRNKQLRFKATLSDTEEGTLKAVFSVFDVIDSDGDVVLASAIENGKEIPLVWAHDWSRPIGKGTVLNDGKQAVFDGKFFLDTTWGSDAYKTVKAMGDLQEYSWGFRITEQEKGEKNGRAVNFIKGTEHFEVSPVLIGANRETYTLEVKEEKPALEPEKKFYAEVSADGTFEQLKDELNTAFRDRQFGDDPYMGWSCIVATYDDRFVAELWKWDDSEETYWEVPYSRTSDGEILLGDPKQVTLDVSFEPVGVSPSVTQTMSYETHADYTRFAVQGLIKRSNTGSELRRKEGRAISSTRRASLETVVGWLNDASKQIQDLLDETAPSSDEDGKSGREVYAQFLRIEARLNGVEI